MPNDTGAAAEPRPFNSRTTDASMIDPARPSVTLALSRALLIIAVLLALPFLVAKFVADMTGERR